MTLDSQPYRKRTLSNESSSTASKRANSQDPANAMVLDLSDDAPEHSPVSASLGASNLRIDTASDTADSSPGPPELEVPREHFGSSSVVPPPPYDSTDNDPLLVLAPSRPPPEPSTQFEIVKDYSAAPLVEGEDWYLVSRSWYRKWQTACSGVLESKEDELVGVDEIGPIDNSAITDSNGRLKVHVAQDVDLVLLPEPVWRFLSEWYGVRGPVFQRKVIGGPGTERVEFHPPTFSFQLLVPTSSATPVQIPVETPAPLTLHTNQPLHLLRTHVATVFNLNPSRAFRLWRLSETENTSANSGPTYRGVDNLLEDGAELIEINNVTPDSTLNEALLDGIETRIGVEQQTEDGKWLIDTTTATWGAPKSIVPNELVAKKKLFAAQFFANKENQVKSQASTSTSTLASASASKGVFSAISGALTRSKSGPREGGGQRGLTGLTNLGNTCFMNSALQCMSNTKELQEYFIAGVYKNELNRTNPLGMGGQVAEAFGALIERLWSGSGSVVAPREFKQTLSKFAPAFSGYGQQDSQELLQFFLDGTHEDLNRIKKPPPTITPDWHGGDDAAMVELARVSWAQHKSRNDSVVVDLFQGQYRSTLVCPDCDKVSITFDPFTFVTLQLPTVKMWTGTVFFVPLDPTKPRYSIELQVPKDSNIKALKAAIGGFMGCDPKCIVGYEEWKSKMYKIWFDDEQVAEVKSDSDRLVFFECASPLAQPRFYGKAKPGPPAKMDDHILVALVHSYTRNKKKSAFGSFDTENFGTPFIVSLTPAEAATMGGIQKAFARQYARVSKRGEDLIELLEGADVDGQPFSVDSMVPPPPSLVAPSAIPLPDTPPTHMDVDDPTQVQGQSEPYIPTVVVAPPSILSAPAPPPSASPSNVLPFSLLIHRDPPKNKQFTLNESIGSTTVPLESRLSSRHIVPTSQVDVDDIFPSATQGLVSNGAQEEEDITMATDSEPSSTPPLLPPLLSTGDTLYAQWDPNAYEYYFGKDTSDSQSLWNDVTPFIDPAVTASKASKGSKPIITLQDCLHEFSKEERLGEDDTWYCSDCKKHQQATKKVELWKVPDVLVLSLKRFRSGRWGRDKIDDYVEFPVDGFDMTPFVEGEKVERRLSLTPEGEQEPIIYDLYAVDNHYGGLGGGHYTAYAKNWENGKWYDFDDSRVSPIDPSSVRTKAAYVLFYRRRTARPIGAKTRELVDSAIQSRAGSRAGSALASPALSRSSSAEGIAQTNNDPSLNLNTNTLDPSTSMISYGLYSYPSSSSGLKAETRFVGEDSDDARSDVADGGRGSPFGGYDSPEDSDPDSWRKLKLSSGVVDRDHMRSWQREEEDGTWDDLSSRGTGALEEDFEEDGQVQEVLLEHHRAGEDLDSI